jgi:hypothetical protein
VPDRPLWGYVVITRTSWFQAARYATVSLILKDAAVISGEKYCETINIRMSFE